jgi:hypothetical protein
MEIRAMDIHIHTQDIKVKLKKSHNLKFRVVGLYSFIRGPYAGEHRMDLI